MKIKKLLKIILVAPSYLIVSYNGNNRTVYCDSSSYSTGDMYELEEDSAIEPKPISIKKEKFKSINDGEQKKEV
jgi:hypothetical protein